MPNLDELNEIKSNLLSLGDEPGILAAKGETPVDIGPPETGLSADLNALFDGFADVDEDEASEPVETDDESNGIEDFEFNLDDEEPAFDMDGFDAPEPDPSVPELVEGDKDIGLDELEDLGFEDNQEPADSNNMSFEDLISDDLEPENVDSFDESDFSIPEDLSVDIPVSDTPDSEPFDELAVPPAEEDEVEDLNFEEDNSALEESIFSDEDMGLDELSADTDLDYSDSEDFPFDDSFADTPVPDQFDELTVPPDEGAEGSSGDIDLDLDDLDDGIDLSLDDELSPGVIGESDDFDLSGEDFELDDSDNDGFPEIAGNELELGGDEELSLDDSDADSMDLDEFEIDDSLDEDLDIDEFDLGDLGQDFGVLEEDLSDVLSADIPVNESIPAEEELEEEFEISEDKFNRVKATMQLLPGNLKLIIEEEIGEKGLKGAPLHKLIDALADRKSPKEIAAVTGRIIGRKIKIPASYAKKTGLEFEEEKDSFKYTFMHNILPLLKIFAVSLIILSAVGYAGFKFIYKPIYANILYNRGYKQLEESNFKSSSDYFDLAFNEYKIKKQFYRYAEAYIDADQWSYARAQYEKLLKNYPFDKKGTMDYAGMEFKKLADYEHSTEILNNFLSTDDNKRDQDALLLLGDIYLEWGWENYDKYDDARLAYAKIMSTYGLSNKILFRMLRYFIRTDNEKEVAVLKKRFQSDSELDVDPEAYAELAAYQIDHQDISDVQELLFRAKKVDDSLADIHYQLARYFRITDEGSEEDKALTKTFASLDRIHTLNRKDLQIKIDAYRRQGERFYQKEEYLQSEEDFHKGIELLSDSRKRNIIKGKSSMYGELYADLGNIYYYISQDPDKALDIYEKAENEGFYSKDVYYNKGNIRYRNRDFRQALLEFYKSAGSFSVNSNLLYATANTLFQRNDFFAAEGYYNHLLDILEQKISNQTSVRLDEREDQRVLVENLMKAYNNMGVTLYGLFQRTGDPSKFTAAMLDFTRSNEYFDDLTRNPESLKRTEMINLASLNQRKLLYPIPDYELQIFPDIPKYLNP